MACEILQPQTGTAFELEKGQLLRVIDLKGEQVADLTAFNRDDHEEWLSSGRTIDYANTIYLTTDHLLYSNRSRPMLTIVQDDVGRHDFLLTPCSPETFKIIYDDDRYHPSCFENLHTNLEQFGIAADRIPTTLNIFMNVTVASDGSLAILPPRSRAGDTVTFRAEMDLIVGLTACSAEMSNNYAFKPIGYEILDPTP
ncbi:MAG TPA: urea carboxylase-associated family protein [Chthoniobacterales bacterium]|nr:urea carboxylase-associated family protein [Chthoniobacterales bacterium]